jgi:plastocyanin
MRTIWMGLLCVTVMGGALVGCGDDTEPNTTGTNATGTGTGGMGGTGGAGGGMGGMGGAGGGMMGSLINGCDPATAVDHTKDKMVTVNFGPQPKYEPACIRIKVGSQVTFSGNFMFHPTVGGTVSGLMATPDPMSPIKETKAGMGATFAFDKEGNYPYYCTVHYGVGMMGAVFVEP